MIEESKLEAAGAAAAKADRSRNIARIQAARTMIDLELAVKTALGGHNLSGLPNIGTGTDTIPGVRVRSDYPDRKLRKARRNMDPVPALCIGRDGTISMIHIGHTEIVERPVAHGELVAEDLELVVQAYRYAIGRHLDGAAKTIARTTRILELSRLIGDAIDGWSSQKEGGGQ